MYLFVLEDQTLENHSEITDEDRVEIAYGTLYVIRYENGKFQELSPNNAWEDIPCT